MEFPLKVGSMLSVFFVVATCTALATTRNVLLDESIPKLNGSSHFAVRYSNNIQEDARLNVVSGDYSEIQ